MRRPFKQVDVFTATPYRGNPVAVVLDGAGIDDDALQRFAHWTNLSETTFLLPPEDASADYRVRIFTPSLELPFAGHPTLGTCHAWLQAGGRPKRAGLIVQECGVGLVEVRPSGEGLAFSAPPFTRTGPLTADERAAAAKVAGVRDEWIEEAVHVANGPQWQLLRLRSAEDVLAARPAASAPVGTDVGLAGPVHDGSGADWELRAFFANQREAIVEDPVTGSFNAGVALHLFGSGLARGRYLAAQGRMTGADGLVECVQDDDGKVWIGGRSVTIAEGASLRALRA